MNLQDWYRKQGVVEVIWLIVVTCSVFSLTSCANKSSEVVVKSQPEKSRLTFGEWCRDQENLSPEAKNTVRAMLQEAA